MQKMTLFRVTKKNGTGPAGVFQFKSPRQRRPRAFVQVCTTLPRQSHTALSPPLICWPIPSVIHRFIHGPWVFGSGLSSGSQWETQMWKHTPGDWLDVFIASAITKTSTEKKKQQVILSMTQSCSHPPIKKDNADHFSNTWDTFLSCIFTIHYVRYCMNARNSHDKWQLACVSCQFIWHSLTRR